MWEIYVTDVVAIRVERTGLTAISLYIGDGGSMGRPIVRPRGTTQIGHVLIRERQRWCRRRGVRRAIFMHC